MKTIGRLFRLRKTHNLPSVQFTGGKSQITERIGILGFNSSAGTRQRSASR